ncbi:MAG: hypothetical protein ACO3EE_05365 [Flavobacteriales bacterium]
MMKKIFFGSMIILSVFSCGNSSETAALEDKESTVNVSAYKAEQGNLQWVRVDNGEQIEIMPLSDSLALPDSLKNEGVLLEFVGNYYKEKQPFIVQGDTFFYKTILYKSFAFKGKGKVDEAASVSENSVLPFSQIDTTNFFQSFAAYVQNGNIYEMMNFYDSAYYQRRCVQALANDTAKCMNEQYCGEFLKGNDGAVKSGCMDYNDIESIEFLGITNEMDENIANYKISSADGRVIKLRMFYKKKMNGKKPSYAIIGN